MSLFKLPKTKGDENWREMMLKYMEYCFYKHDSREIYNYYLDSKLDYLKTILCNDLQYKDGGVYEIVEPGFKYINNVTMNILATSTIILLKKYEPNIRELHGKKFDTTKFYDVTKRVFIGYDSRPDSRGFVEIIARVFFHRGFIVHVAPDPVVEPFVSFMASSPIYTTGIFITGGMNSEKYSGFQVYLEDGCPLTEKLEKKLNEIIKFRIHTPITENLEIECFNFMLQVKIFMTNFPLIFKTYFHEFFNRSISVAHNIVTIYCFKKEFRTFLEVGIKHFGLIGTVHFYPYKNIQDPYLGDCSLLDESRLRASGITTYAEKSGSKLILLLGFEGKRCQVLYSAKNKWVKAKSSHVATMFMHWFQNIAFSASKQYITTWNIDNLTSISAMRYKTRFVKIPVNSRKPSDWLCLRRKDENRMFHTLFFDEKDQFMIHSGIMPSALQIATFITGMAQFDKIHVILDKIKNEFGPFSMFKMLYFTDNINETIKKLENILSIRGKEIKISHQMYCINFNNNTTLYIQPRNQYIIIRIYIRGIENPNKFEIIDKIKLELFDDNFNHVLWPFSSNKTNIKTMNFRELN
ncbi:hypothetical protein EDEG_03818 [Edhazardia aedis USNM 41457]|uniref:Alpha-D-phosphohexomutase alpha/beta/alpha domain-containing protein n=1 Tax=Edhazardia aedis (strain USNM 41457) TaxID=1003232 RepID=J8ZPN0_EDHAE|nr:hypothetical protein EDEG_03818 [Edhazardia aedis USNM 41457]|eukprot:EJW01638.1 hypothetical protein EDEG_03818 [Edhazardia aedis USNM 41457]